MAFSSVGGKKIAAQVVLFIVNLFVLGFASKVNQFQEYFFVADLFPLALSIITFLVLFILLAFEFASQNSFLGRPHIEGGIYGVLTILWLAFNSFSTPRWQQVPFHCSSIPPELPDEHSWCNNLQGLKGFVWVEFLYFFFFTLFIVRYSVTQYNRGEKHIFSTPLSRFRPASQGIGFTRDSEFLQFEKSG